MLTVILTKNNDVEQANIVRPTLEQRLSTPNRSIKEFVEQVQSHFKTVVVAGTSSGVGKTSVAVSVTKYLSGQCNTGAGKITVTHGDRGCPHGGKGCNVCSSLGGDYQIVETDSVISQPGTDTSRLKIAGGRPVVWAITRDVAIKPAWQRMIALLTAVDCVVIESNSLAEHITPSLTLMVVDASVGRRIWKPSSERLIQSADYVVFNSRGSLEQRKLLQDEIELLRGNLAGVIYIDHPTKLENHPDLMQSLNSLLIP